MVQTVIFLIGSLVTLGAALAVVTSKNLFHSALFLVLSFVGVAGLYVLLEAPFLAAVQILVYVGAIAILIVFAIMLTRQLMAQGQRYGNEQWWLVAVVAFFLFVALGFIVTRVDWQIAEIAPPADIISLLGQDLMSAYALPFEVASVLLLVALIGSIMIARVK